MLDILSRKTPSSYNVQIKAGSITTFINPVSYLKARKKRRIYNKFDNLLIDGWLLVRALRLIGIPTRRYSFDMTSIASKVFSESMAQKKSIYFIGAKHGEIERFIVNIKQNFEELNIVGYRDGYFKNNEERELTLSLIQKIAPEVVIVGLGVPLQEKFLIDLQDAGWEGCGFTCGGFLHQTIGRLNYYPDWINNYNLRMPYRFIKEPHFRRRLPDYFRFLLDFTYDVWRLRSKLSKSKVTSKLMLTSEKSK